MVLWIIKKYNNHYLRYFCHIINVYFISAIYFLLFIQTKSFDWLKFLSKFKKVLGNIFLITKKCIFLFSGVLQTHSLCWTENLSSWTLFAVISDLFKSYSKNVSSKWKLRKFKWIECSEFSDFLAWVTNWKRTFYNFFITFFSKKFLNLYQGKFLFNENTKSYGCLNSKDCVLVF